MKIYFCDLCNESIRQEDLERSRVTTTRGKMICAKCLPAAPAGGAATGAAAGAPAAARGGGAVALLAIAALGLGGFGLHQALTVKDALAARTDPKEALANLGKQNDRLLEDGVAIRGRLETLAARQEKLASEPVALREALAEQLHRIESAERSQQELSTLLASLRSDREMVGKLELRLGGLDKELDGLQGQVQGLAARVTALGTAPVAVPAAAEPGAADGPAPEPAFDAETKKRIAELSSKDEGVRWQAADYLAKKRDVALVKYLLPLLEDKDTFVKFRVIQAMQDLNAKVAVGRLVKLLRDGADIVRGQAQDALIALTGNNERFKLEGTPAEVEKGVKAWEEWYEKNKARFAEGSSS
jgi:hypothetical protein